MIFGVKRDGGVERGRVSVRAAPSSDRATTILFDGTVLAFGRGAQCDIRFGHAPIQDREVPRLCGWLVVAHGRVAVHAADADIPAPARDGDGFRPVVVQPRCGPQRVVRPGEIWAPADAIFTVRVQGGEVRELDVVNFRGPSPAAWSSDDDPPTVQPRVELTDELWAVLRAYAEPMQRGGRAPATHDEVAQRINWNKMTARRRLEKIYDEFYLHRLEMPDVDDMRVKVVEAALHHGLLPMLSDA